MTDPIVYGPAYSTYTRTVRLALEEKGVPYGLEEVDILSGANTTPEYLARHPFGKVPAFEHDGFRLYEVGAITRYIDEAFEGASLQPADARQRARMTQVFGIIDSYAYPPMITQIFVQRQVVPLQGGTPDEAAIESAVPQAQNCIEVLERLLGTNSFLAGGSLSLADLHLIPVYDYFAQTAEGERLLEGAPNLVRWWGSVSERPSVEKTKPALG